MNIEKIMDGFEAWMAEMIPAIYQGERVMLHRYDTIGEPEEILAKAAWQASRAALVIPVIGTATDYPDDSEPGARYWNNARDEQIALIEAAGLRTEQ